MTKNRIAACSPRPFSRKGNTQKHKKVAFSVMRPLLVLMLLALFALTFVLSSGKIPTASASLQSKGDAPISEDAMRQIQALIEEKESRTPAQRKIDSQLIYALKASRSQNIAAGVPTLEIGAKVDGKNGTVVDIRIAHDTDLKTAVPLIEQNGAEILSAVYNNVRARVNLENLEAIAALPQVRFIMPRQEAKLAGQRSLGGQPGPLASLPMLQGMSAGFSDRVARVRAQLLSALVSRGNFGKTSAQSANQSAQFGPRLSAINTSEGDKTHKADTGRSSFGVNGTGVKVGVLSDGVSSLASVQASGDLPAGVTVLPGQTGSGDEGTAMLEIVHDLAPGAQLFFATAFTSLTSFAQNIRDLRTAGCDIIIDDVLYFVETPMQDGQAPTVVSPSNGGLILQAVNDVTAAGAMYFSSAGNEGSVDKSTAGAWEGDFVSGGTLGIVPGGNVNDFDPGAGVAQSDQLTVGTGAPVTLFWSDPLGASSNDYDLFILNSTSTSVLASSTNIQNGNDDPIEILGVTTPTGRRAVILQKTGAANRFLHLNTFGGELAFATPGETHGHSQGALAFSVAATAAAATPFGGPNGPFPNPFTAANKVETFSSDGPRRILFNANSTPITPGNFSSTGGVLRQKPDITAADGVSCVAPGFATFFGTSAAAPHAGAIAALLKSANLSFTPAQIRTALTSSAIDIEGAGVDRDSGAGIVMAFEALQAIGAVPQPVIVSAGATLVAESCAPANGALDPGETVTVSFCVQNTGGVNTSSLVGTLQATGGVTSPSGPQNYGVVIAGGPAVCRNFTFTASGTCGGTVTASIQFQDGATNLGTLTYTFSLGVLNTAFQENFDGVTAPALPAGWASATTAGAANCTPTGTCALTSQWTTVTTSSDTAPNSAFHNDPSCVTDSTLDTPSIAITSAGSQVTFRHSFNVEDTFDGGVLEISINGGAFADIVTSGGSFVTGDYTDTISVNFLSPIAGRRAWSGNSLGFITSTANLPAAANGQNIKLRFRMASDCSLGVTGWNIDTVKVTAGFTCSSCAAACTLTCPANVTKANDPNQCGAVVNYPAPTTTGTCGTVTCAPASGSFFPKGTTTVTCSSPAPASCSFTVTVNDTQPPTITCPPNQTAVAPTVTSTCAVVNFTTTASDNCPGVTVICNPASGSCFPVGVSTVTCTATDASSNTATCSFSVSVFNARLQDDSEGCTNTVLINTVTGDYRWCCHGTIFTGRGKMTKLGNTFTVEHNAADRRVLIKVSAGSTPPSGTASLQSPVGTIRCTITDRDTRNDTCVCGGPQP